MSKEMRNMMDNFKRLLTEAEEKSNIETLMEKYQKDTKYDVENSLGNCSFFARDVINWAKENNIKASYVYMPMSEEYRRKNKIGKDFGGNDADWEDHIVPMINKTIIDYTYTENGVSHKVRTKNTIPPMIVQFDKSLFEPDGVYGKWGYTKPEVNTTYGKPKDINQFKVTEPKLKVVSK